MTNEMGNYLAFPFGMGSNGKTSQVKSLEDHVRDELMQLVLTNIGERLFLPEFGTGVRRLVFNGADESKNGMVKAVINQAISRWLGDRMTLQDLAVDIQNETVKVTIKYAVTGTNDSKVLTFQNMGG